MKFLLVSKCGEGAHLLWKIKEEGNDVRMCVEEKDYKSVFSGIIERVTLANNWIDRETIILFDSSGMGELADEFRDNGFKVFGSSKFADKLEYNRNYGLNVMQSCGISVPEYVQYESYEFEDAIAYINASKDNKKFVFKPSGDLPSNLTYIGEDREDLIIFMEFVEKNHGDKIDDFILQEFIEGTIVSSEYWCDGKKFIGPANHTVEVKKFMNDDLGPSTGCSGNIVWLAEESSPIIQKGIKRIEKLCVQKNYIGPIDLNTIFSGDEIYGLEWTPRFGLDAMPTFLQLLDCEVGKFISDMALGQFPNEMAVLDAFAGGIRLTIPPYPIEPKSTRAAQKQSPNRGIPLRGLSLEDKDNLYLYEVELDPDVGLVHSDGTGIVLVASDATERVDTCLITPYQILEEAKIPNKQYRTDLREVLPEMYKEVVENIKCLTI